MINHILILLSVNNTKADFTFWVCVAVSACAYCQKVHYFAGLQQRHQCYVLLRCSQNLPNQHATMLYTNSVRLKNSIIYY